MSLYRAKPLIMAGQSTGHKMFNFFQGYLILQSSLLTSKQYSASKKEQLIWTTTSYNTTVTRQRIPKIMLLQMPLHGTMHITPPLSRVCGSYYTLALPYFCTVSLAQKQHVQQLSLGFFCNSTASILILSTY